MTGDHALDIDNPATWPTGLTAAVRAGGRAAAKVAALVEGRDFRAYHCCRLLPHELNSIAREGLRPSALSLVSEKLVAAVEAGVIDRDRAERLEAGSVMRPDARAGDRAGQVRLCVGLGHFSGSRQRGVELLLSTWGGEGIYWHAEEADRDVLRGIGTPSIVVVEVPLSGERMTMFPCISDLLRDALGEGEGSPVGEVVLRAAVGASAIVDIWQPGMAEYDIFDGLPGTVSQG